MINPYHEAYHDSLKKMTYPYTFPFLGKKAYKNGFDIPYVWGISPVYFAQRQDIKIAEIAVGLNDGPLADISGLVSFGRIENKVSTFTVRPDLWVLPFLNIMEFLDSKKQSCVRSFKKSMISLTAGSPETVKYTMYSING